jgi:hypothetical protein
MSEFANLLRAKVPGSCRVCGALDSLNNAITRWGRELCTQLLHASCPHKLGSRLVPTIK